MKKKNKQAITDNYNAFIKEHNGNKPNAVFAHIKMRNTEPNDYDTPYFCGYILFLSDKEIDEYYEKGSYEMFGINEVDLLYIVTDLDELFHEIEHPTDFTIKSIDDFEIIKRK